MRPPVVKNMMKGLYFQFTVGLLPMFAVTFMGYWAYGPGTSTYLLNSVGGPVWVKTMANVAALLQTVIALHVRFLPIFFTSLFVFLVLVHFTFLIMSYTTDHWIFLCLFSLVGICVSNVRVPGY